MFAQIRHVSQEVFQPHQIEFFKTEYRCDLNWRSITALHKARGVPKQGAKLGANQLAARLEAIHAAKLSKAADARNLKGEARLSWMLKKLKKDLRTDERQLRRILAKSRDGT